jgi:hypothetical protein
MKKKQYFVCINYYIKKDICIEADSMQEAEKKFFEITKARSNSTYGPFFKKRGYSIKNEQTITLSGKQIRAIYDDWYVKAHLLSIPANSALLFFEKRVDERKIAPPNDNLIVNIGELTII